MTVLHLSDANYEDMNHVPGGWPQNRYRQLRFGRRPTSAVTPRQNTEAAIKQADIRRMPPIDKFKLSGTISWTS